MRASSAGNDVFSESSLARKILNATTARYPSSSLMISWGTSRWNATQFPLCAFNFLLPMWKCPVEALEVSPRPTKNVPTRPVSSVSQCDLKKSDLQVRKCEFCTALLVHYEEGNVFSTTSGCPARILAWLGILMLGSRAGIADLAINLGLQGLHISISRNEQNFQTSHAADPQFFSSISGGPVFASGTSDA